MRITNSLKNIVISILSQIILIILSFFSRKIFIDSLGTEYLGINGVLTNVISAMVLIESGIAISIVYNLYKPLAEGNTEKIIALVQLYKKAYLVLTGILFLLSLALMPFLQIIMNTESPIEGLNFIYMIFVFQCMLGYLNGHKWALVNADQKGYILTLWNTIIQIIIIFFKIVVLYTTSNYICYLVVELLVTFVGIVIKTKIVHKRYPYIKTKVKYIIDDNTKRNIVMNVKAMFFHNIGGYLVNSTDNILMSIFVSVQAVGLYSNYSMIIVQLVAFVSSFTNGINGSVGNLIATEGKNKIYNVFLITFLITFWVNAFVVIFLYNLLEPFINWWLGEGLLLDKAVFVVILINVYLTNVKNLVYSFKTKAGLFVQDKYSSVLEGGINLVVSIVLINKFGLIGVFLGTTISTLAIPFWNQARIIYKYAFEKNVWEYYIKFVAFTCIGLGVGVITTKINHILVTGTSFLSLVISGIICVLVINGLFLMLFYNTKEFRYIKSALVIQLSKFLKKTSEVKP